MGHDFVLTFEDCWQYEGRFTWIFTEKHYEVALTVPFIIPVGAQIPTYLHSIGNKENSEHMPLVPIRFCNQLGLPTFDCNDE